MTDAFIFLTRNPETAPRLLKKFHKAAKQAKQDFDFHICSFVEEGEQTRSKADVNGEQVDYWVFGKKDAVSLGYSPKVTSEDWVFIPGNVDVLLLNFFKLNKEYERYWQVEDDVDYSGETHDLLNVLSEYDDDLLCTHLQRGWQSWTYSKLLRTGTGKHEIKLEDTMLCFLPFLAISHLGLSTLDRAYSAGWAGHPEQTWPTILLNAGLNVRDIGGSGEFVSPDSIDRYYFGDATQSRNKTGSFTPTPPRLFVGRKPDTLWHPVKPFDQWVSGKLRRLKSIVSYYRSRLNI